MLRDDLHPFLPTTAEAIVGLTYLRCHSACDADQIKRSRSLHGGYMRKFDALALPVTDHVGDVLNICRDTLQCEVTTTVLCVGCHGRRLWLQLSCQVKTANTMKAHGTVHEQGKHRYSLTSSLLQVVCSSCVSRPVVDTITAPSFSSYVRRRARVSATHLTYGVSGALSQVVTPTLPPPRL